MCDALVKRGWHRTECSKNPSRTLEGLSLCGQHANMALRWLREGRLASMADFWWNVQTRRKRRP